MIDPPLAVGGSRGTSLPRRGGHSISSIAGFGQDGAGELHIVERGTGADGEVYKILPEQRDTTAPSGRRSGLEFRSIAPNPSSPTTSLALLANEPGELEIRVLDASGRSLRLLASGTVGEGPVMVDWDGRDEAGRDMPAGVYSARARLERQRITRSVGTVRQLRDACECGSTMEEPHPCSVCFLAASVVNLSLNGGG